MSRPWFRPTFLQGIFFAILQADTLRLACIGGALEVATN